VRNQALTFMVDVPTELFGQHALLEDGGDSEEIHEAITIENNAKVR